MVYIYKHKKQSTNNDRAPVELPAEVEHLRYKLGMCRLVDVVCAIKEVTGITTNDMRTNGRKADLVEAKQLFYYFTYMLKKDSIKQPYRHTLEQLTAMLYQKHCSAIHGKKTVERIMSVDKILRNKIIIIANLIIQKNEQFRDKLQAVNSAVHSTANRQS